MRRIRKLMAVLLVAVMMCTLYSGSMTPVLAKAEPAAGQEETEEMTEAPETEAEETKTEVESPEAEEPDKEEGKTEEKEEEEKKPEAAAEQKKAAEEKKEAAQKAVEEKKETTREVEEETGAKAVRNQMKAAESKQNSGTEEPAVKLTNLSLKEDGTNISAPQTLTLELEVEMADASDGISYIYVEYSHVDTGEIFFYEQNDRVWYPEEGAGELQINISKYAATGKYYLYHIGFNTTGGENIDYYWNYDQFLECWNDDGSIMLDQLKYSGEADYTVVKSEETDNEYPEITGIRLSSNETVFDSGTGELALDIDYKEDSSGIRRIDVFWERVDIDSSISSLFLSTNYYVGDNFGEGQYVGEGTIRVERNYEEPLELGIHRIESVCIEDYAGHIRWYSIEEEGTLTSYEDEESRVTPEVKTIMVEEVPSNGLKIGAMRVEDGVDRTQLSAGDSFDVIVTVYNDTEQDVKINPSWCYMSWSTQSGHSLDANGEGGVVTLLAGGTVEISFSVKTNPHAIIENYYLRDIQLNNYYVDESIPATQYTNYNIPENIDEERLFYGTNEAVSGYMDMFLYKGEIDLAITKSDNPDMEAPIIQEVSVISESATAPGEIEILVKTEGVEATEISYIICAFVDKNNEYNTVYMEGEPIYSKEQQGYILNGKLDNTIVKGTYILSEICIDDKAGNTTAYFLDEAGEYLKAELWNGKVSVINPCEFTVTQSTAADEDFIGPVLKGITLVSDNSVEPGGTLQYLLDIEDAHGLTEVLLMYYGTSDAYDFISLESKNVILQNNGYLCEFEVEPYAISGEYTLMDIILTDGSVRNNNSYFVYEKINNTILGNEDGPLQLPKETNLDLSVTEPTDKLILDLGRYKDNLDKIPEDLEEVENNGTVVIKGSYVIEETMPNLSKDLLEIVKAKELTVILPNYFSTSEIVINGSNLPETLTEDLELRIDRGELIEGESGVGEDNLFYYVRTMVSDATVPLTLRIKVDQKFLDERGRNSIRISPIEKDGTLGEVLWDDLQVNADGYIEIRFDDGLQGEGTASQILYADLNGTNGESTFILSSKIDESDVMLGDINGDGEIDIFDLTQCMNHIVEKAQLAGDKYKAADVNEDGEVDIFDLTRIMNYIVEKTDMV